MPISFPKAGLDFQGQLSHLEAHGLIILDKQAALETLRHTSFYRLRGYYIHLYDRNTKKFHPKVTFEDIVQLHQFDMDLTSLILNVTSHIEISLRAYLANEICLASHAMGHLDCSNFSDSLLFMSNAGAISSEILRSREVFIEHFKTHYKSQVPVWAVVEVASFGTLSKLFKSLDMPIKKAITQKYYLRGSYTNWVESWLHTATVLRNRCAHRARLYNYLMNVSPSILAVDKEPNLNAGTIYGAMLALKYLTEKNPDAPDWLSLLSDLIVQYDKVVDVAKLGFPQCWKNHLK